MSPRAALVYEHVAFDLDGTLIDSRADLTAAVNHVLRQSTRVQSLRSILAKIRPVPELPNDEEPKGDDEGI